MHSQKPKGHLRSLDPRMRLVWTIDDLEATSRDLRFLVVKGGIEPGTCIECFLRTGLVLRMSELYAKLGFEPSIWEFFSRRLQEADAFAVIIKLPPPGNALRPIVEAYCQAISTGDTEAMRAIDKKVRRFINLDIRFGAALFSGEHMLFTRHVDREVLRHLDLGQAWEIGGLTFDGGLKPHNIQLLFALIDGISQHFEMVGVTDVYGILNDLILRTLESTGFLFCQALPDTENPMLKEVAREMIRFTPIHIETAPVRNFFRAISSPRTLLEAAA